MVNDQGKVQMLGDTPYRYSSEWIHSLESQRHWRLYWQQQKLMQDKVKPGQHILEIGVGSGFTANYLRSKGISVTTLDIDAEKRPDIVANIVTYDFSQEYDHVLAFEVLEHIPFPEAQRALQKLSQICRGYLFLSVPRNERVWLRGEFYVAKLGQWAFAVATRKKRITTAHHFWEIDDSLVSKRSFEQTMGEYGYRKDNSMKFLSRLFYAYAAPQRARQP